MNDPKCEDCGGRLDRPGLFGCDDEPHPAPDLAQRIAAAIEADLNDRKGMGFGDAEEAIQYAIRDRWAELIRIHLA